MPGRISFLATLLALGEYVFKVFFVNLSCLLYHCMLTAMTILYSIEYKVGWVDLITYYVYVYLTRFYILESFKVESVDREDLVVRGCGELSGDRKTAGFHG